MWTGSRMMLSEHRYLLNQRQEKQIEECDVERENDEQQLEEWEELFDVAINNDIKVKITIADNGTREFIGEIINCDSELGLLYLKLQNDEIKKIYIKDVRKFLL